MGRIDIKKIRKAIRRKKYYITLHTRKNLRIRKIKMKEIKQVILKGNIIEEYLKDKPFPSCLIIGFIRNKEPLYVVCALDYEGYTRIITVHWQDPKKWIDPWTRRRKK